MRKLTRLLAVGLLLAAAACQYADPNTTYPRSKPGGKGGGTYEPKESIFGGEGITLFGSGGKSSEAPAGSGIGVNSYLWRAALDTLSFMPLASADPFGGVIITDWYVPPEGQGDRLKVNVYILGRDLRSDGIRAAVFRQHRDESGGWVDAPVQDETAVELENAILTRARELRVAGLQ